MKSISKILVGAASVVALTVVSAPAAHAQCGAPQPFASVGLSMTFKQITIDTTGTDNTGKEIGRFWVANDSTRGNNFSGSCPSTNVDPLASWWDLCSLAATCGAAPSANRGINGSITALTCTANTCPDLVGDQLTVLVEEWAAGGPPGIGNTAFWVGFRVDTTQPVNASRNWDLSRVTGAVPANTTLPFLQFPTPVVTGSLRNLTGGVDTTNNYVDIGLNLHSAAGASNGAIADTATILSYDLCTFHGAGDPGRLRTNGWSCGSSVPYAGGAVTGNPFKVPCADAIDDTWVAIGMTFSGGAGPAVKSAMVGRAVQVECNPTIADPEPLKRPGLRPTQKKTGSTPTRSGR